jgi:hypothetical protein
LIDRLKSKKFKYRKLQRRVPHWRARDAGQKSKAKEVTFAAAAPRGGKVIDIMEALSAAWKECRRRREQR